MVEIPEDFTEAPMFEQFVKELEYLKKRFAADH